MSPWGALRWAKRDPDLDPLRGDPLFGAMLQRVEARLAADPTRGG